MNLIEKEKLETCPDISLQVITEKFSADSIDITTDNRIMDLSLEKRKEAASKPIYLTRI